jgi:catechol 2,3-dioxygenase-like lactoylglutathione lyase family enzyme
MPRLVGINHVALEVGSLAEALDFWNQIFEIQRVDREPGMLFHDMGDQFNALSERRSEPPDTSRHFGLVVDDKEAVRKALAAAGAEILPGRFLDFRDPWGNRVQVVDYRDIQFMKTDSVMRGMGLEGLSKRPAALDELRNNGLL